MNKSVIRCLAAGWVGTMGLVNLSQAVAAGEPESRPQMTLFVYNRAQVEPETLQKANEVAARIFQNAGIEVAVVVDPPPTGGEETAGNRPPFPPPLAFFVQILPPEMANRLRFPSTILGFAPGTPEEHDRNKVYVFDHVAARMAHEQATARVSKIVSFTADKGQILGYGMAHEIGHVLLHQESHSPKGIMQANWDGYALADIATGRLNFSPEEAARIQAEAARRSRNQGIVQGAGLGRGELIVS